MQKPPGIRLRTWQKLSGRAQAFVSAYLEDGANAITAYVDAGYVESADAKPPRLIRRNAGSVLNGKAVQAALREHAAHAEQLDRQDDRLTRDWLRRQLEDVLDRARTAGDLAGMTRALQLLGQMIGAFADVHIDIEARREYEAEEIAEAQRLARLMLEGLERHRQLPAGERPAVTTGEGLYGSTAHSTSDQVSSQVRSGVLEGVCVGMDDTEEVTE